MKIGVIKEIKDKENRVAITPAGVLQLTQAGHLVLVETQAGEGSGFTDADYQQAGAQIVSAVQAWAVDLVVKVKEPLPAEYPYLNGQILFTFLHLAGVSKTLTEALLNSKTTAIAYESVEDADGRLPILAPMSAIAGNMAVMMGAYYLAKFNQGRGVQLARVMNERQGKVLIIGDGVVGQHAASIADGMGARVFLAGLNQENLQHFQQHSSPDVTVFLSSPDSIHKHIVDADLVIGAVLCRGAKAPKVVTEAMVKSMQKSAVIVDVSIDQGGCVETSFPTTHSHPVYLKHGVWHYCVANMPGAYPKTATTMLSQATLGYILTIANNGIAGVMQHRFLREAIHTYQGYITCLQVAQALAMSDSYSTVTELV
jgi:alanine dehydrogenase